MLDGNCNSRYRYLVWKTFFFVKVRLIPSFLYSYSSLNYIYCTTTYIQWLFSFTWCCCRELQTALLPPTIWLYDIWHANMAGSKFWSTRTSKASVPWDVIVWTRIQNFIIFLKSLLGWSFTASQNHKVLL